MKILPLMSQYLFQTEKIEDCRSGIPQIISNIEVCNSISELLSSTLGPYGLDKLIYSAGKCIITNDGATILEHMQFKHPVAKMVASLSKSQDNEVGDGTTSVIILAAEILNSLSSYIKERYSVEEMRKVLGKIRKMCADKIKTLRIEYSEEKLQKLAETCLNSKSIRNDKEYFCKMLIKGLKNSYRTEFDVGLNNPTNGGNTLNNNKNTLNNNLYITKIPGGSLADSILVDGIAFEKTFTYAGYEQQPKKILNPKVCCLNIELEWKSERENCEIRIGNVNEYQAIVDAEWTIIREKLDDIINSGANVVLSEMPIGDYATQYFAAKNVFSAGRVKNLPEIIKAFDGRISNSTKQIQVFDCDLFEERQLGRVRYNYLEGRRAKVQTLILRGPGAEMLEEVERAVHDAICVIKTAMMSKNVITGGGSVEMQLSKMCREEAFKAEDNHVFIYRAISRAFEKIPMLLAENFGLDAVSMMQKLRMEHCSKVHMGVGVRNIEDMCISGVLEPMEVKINMVESAFNLAEAILMINSTIISKK